METEFKDALKAKDGRIKEMNDEIEILKKPFSVEQKEGEQLSEEMQKIQKLNELVELKTKQNDEKDAEIQRLNKALNDAKQDIEEKKETCLLLFVISSYTSNSIQVNKGIGDRKKFINNTSCSIKRTNRRTTITTQTKRPNKYISSISCKYNEETIRTSSAISTIIHYN